VASNKLKIHSDTKNREKIGYLSIKHLVVYNNLYDKTWSTVLNTYSLLYLKKKRKPRFDQSKTRLGKKVPNGFFFKFAV